MNKNLWLELFGQCHTPNVKVPSQAEASIRQLSAHFVFLFLLKQKRKITALSHLNRGKKEKK